MTRKIYRLLGTSAHPYRRDSGHLSVISNLRIHETENHQLVIVSHGNQDGSFRDSDEIIPILVENPSACLICCWPGAVRLKLMRDGYGHIAHQVIRPFDDWNHDGPVWTVWGTDSSRGLLVLTTSRDDASAVKQDWNNIF
jgi:hypothetical protein